LGHVKEPSSCGSLRAAGKIRMFSFLPSLIEVSRAAWCGVPLEMKEGTIPIWGTKVLYTRPRCITLTTHSWNALHLQSVHVFQLLLIGCVLHTRSCQGIVNKSNVIERLSLVTCQL
jgi:hypothetical protein